jgi:putative PepSY-like beta-lactamase-inhibitor
VRFLSKYKKMKNLRLYTITLTLLMVVLSMNTIAQVSSSKAIPQTVITSFNAKYPGAGVKSWKIENGKYVAKAIVDNHKCFVTFDINGNWLNTMSKIKWTWTLPKEVYESYKKTKYRAWHIDYLTKIEMPSGDFYQVIVDDSNQQPDPDHALLFASDKLLEFKPDGTLAKTLDITDNMISYTPGNKM